MKKSDAKKQKSQFLKKNPLEQNFDSPKDNQSFFNQLFGPSRGESPAEKGPWPPLRERGERPKKRREEFTVFAYQNYHETEVVRREIKRLSNEIKSEIEAIKKAEKDLINEVNEIEKEAAKTLPEKPGIYHISFFELILSILRTLRAKVGEAKTWLAAMKTKKKKRGSLFLHRAKKRGTQYSLSSELQPARSVM